MCGKKKIIGTICLLLLFDINSVWGWADHSLGAAKSLSVMPELNALPLVTVQNIAEFLRQQADGLDVILEKEEQWARQNIAKYPPRPDSLAYKYDGALSDKDLLDRFLAAIRVNPNISLTSYLQLAPNEINSNHDAIAWQKLTFLINGETMEKSNFFELKAGEQIKPIDVIIAAANEPDYGMDMGLWQDNDTDFGKKYNFGRQPFGDPRIGLPATQAPFHMGLYHESEVVYFVANFLKRTYPEYRMHLWQTLANHALKSGSPYWGWRFAGWTCHYAEDLTQPYHSNVLPGVGTARMIAINLLAMLGWEKPKNDMIFLVSNRHLSLENIQYNGLLDVLGKKADANPELITAYSDTSQDMTELTYLDLRSTISMKAYAAGNEVDELLVKGLPAHFVNDPNYEFAPDFMKINLNQILSQQAKPVQQALNTMLVKLYSNFGNYTRTLIRGFMQQATSK